MARPDIPKEEIAEEKKELSADYLGYLFRNIGKDFFDAVFMGKTTPPTESQFDPFTIVSLYMASIGNNAARKALAPYFLEALNKCDPSDIARIVEGTRPTYSDTYQTIEAIAKKSNSIEAYICYAFVTTDINTLKIDELNAVMNYLRKHRPDEAQTFRTLQSILTALVYSRDAELIKKLEKKSDNVWIPPDVDPQNLLPIDISDPSCPYLCLSARMNIFKEAKFYCNLSGLKAQGLLLNLPPNVIMERSNLLHCSFNFYCPQNLPFLNLAGSTLNDITFHFGGKSSQLHQGKSRIKVNICNADIRNRFEIKLSFSKDSGSDTTTYPYEALIFILNTATLHSPTPYSHFGLSLPYQIKLPHIRTPEELILEIKKYDLLRESVLYWETPERLSELRENLIKAVSRILGELASKEDDSYIPYFLAIAKEFPEDSKNYFKVYIDLSYIKTPAQLSQTLNNFSILIQHLRAESTGPALVDQLDYIKMSLTASIVVLLSLHSNGGEVDELFKHAMNHPCIKGENQSFFSLFRPKNKYESLLQNEYEAIKTKENYAESILVRMRRYSD